jgi:hypothetical protein
MLYDGIDIAEVSPAGPVRARPLGDATCAPTLTTAPWDLPTIDTDIIVYR